MGASFVRGLGLSLIPLLAVLVLAAPASASSQYVFGAPQYFYSFNCTEASTYGQLEAALAAQAVVGYQGNPAPAANSVYYITLQFTAGGETFNSDGSCTPSEDASMQLGLPPNTSLAISAATPIVCAVADSNGNSTTFTTNCPTAAETGTSPGYYKFDPGGGSEVWSVSDNNTLEVFVPVTTLTAMTNAANKSCTNSNQGCAIGFVQMWDGFQQSGTSWQEYPTEGITVAAAQQQTQPSIGAESSSNITSDSATTQATVNNEGKAGNTAVELYPNSGCTGTPTAIGPQSVGSGTNSFTITTNLTNLSPSITYCWFQEFTPTGGAAVNGAHQTFTTAAAPPTYTPPTFSNFSYTTASTSSGVNATLNATVAYHAAGSTEFQWGGGVNPTDNCSNPEDVQTVDVAPTPNPSGTINISTLVSGLQTQGDYCWRVVFTPSDPGLSPSVSAWQGLKTPLRQFHPAITYANPATQNITGYTAEGIATVNNSGEAGTTAAEIEPSNNGNCYTPTTIAQVNEQAVSASSLNPQETTTFSNLTPGTTYCWRQIWTPAGGSEFDGFWQSFTTHHILLLAGAPTNVSPPSVAGVLAVGQKLTETHGNWNGSPTSYSYQWSRCDSSGAGCTTIAGATAQTYQIQQADQGHTLVVGESATNSHGTAGPISSVATSVVLPATSLTGPPVDSNPPAIAGTPIIGHELTASAGAWSGATPISFAYQWERCGAACAPISGATATTYKPAMADAGRHLEVIVTATNSSGHTAADSAQSPTVTASVTIAQLQGLLRSASVPSGKSERIKALLKHGGYSVSLQVLVAGQIEISWYEVPKGAHVSGAKHKPKPKPVLVARGQAHAAAPGVVTLKLALTGNGRKLLRHSKRVKLTAVGSFKATSQSATVVVSFKLR